MTLGYVLFYVFWLELLLFRNFWLKRFTYSIPQNFISVNEIYWKSYKFLKFFLNTFEIKYSKLRKMTSKKHKIALKTLRRKASYKK